MDTIPALPVYGFGADLGGLLSFVVAVFLPFLAALLSKQSWPGWLTGTLLLVLAFGKTILEAWLAAVNDGVAFDARPVLISTFYNFAIAVLMYFGVFRNTRAIKAAQQSVVKDRTIDGTVVR